MGSTEQNYSRDTSQRLMVSMFYLNDVPKRWRNLFPLSDIKVTTAVSTLVTWRLGLGFINENAISNDKYIITSWMCTGWWYDLELKDGVNEDGSKQLGWSVKD